MFVFLTFYFISRPQFLSARFNLLVSKTKFFYKIVRETSQDGKLAAFCECYAHLHGLRSLAPEVPIIALTATATKLTKNTILNVLLMDNPYEIKESPSKLHLTYIVECMHKDTDLEFYFGWLENKTSFLRENNYILSND